MKEIPVLKIGDILLVSIQIDLNDRVATALQESILQRIQETQATAMLIDISSLGLVDSYVGRMLTDTARMARLMNVNVCLVGMSPVVALTMTEMGLSFPEIGTALSLDLGLEFLGYRLEEIPQDDAEAETSSAVFEEQGELDARS